MSTSVRSDPAAGAGDGLVPGDTRVRRHRQQVDALRLVLLVAAVAGVLLATSVAQSTTVGLEADLHRATNGATWLANLAALISTLALLALPVGVVADLLLRRQPWRIPDVLLATAAGTLLAVAVNAYVDHLGPEATRIALTGFTPSGRQPATAPFVAGITGLLTAADLRGRRTPQVLTWSVVGLGLTTSLLGYVLTPVGALLTLLAGRTGGILTRYALGLPSTRPSAAAVLAALRAAGVHAVSLRAVGPPQTTHRYRADLPDGGTADVRVIDRDLQGAGVFTVMYRWVRLRTPVRRRALLSVRRALEHEALVSLAAEAAGACTPRLLAVAEAGPDAGVIAHRHVPATPLALLPENRIDDDLLRRVWRELSLLHGHRISLKGLTPDSITVDGTGKVWLSEMRTGDVASSDLALRMDSAQLLSAIAEVVGPERAVATALDVLGPQSLVSIVPLLQPVALHPLAHGLRRSVKAHRDLLDTLRARILTLTGRTDADTEPVRIERVNARTILTIVVTITAAYLLASQFGHIDVRRVVRHASWWWAAVAVGGSVASYLGASASMIGFASQRLPLWRTMLAQMASSFVSTVAPAAVGVVAVNVRYLQRRGVDGAMAVATVGVTQLASFLAHLSLLLVFGLLTGRASGGSLLPSRTVLIALAVLVPCIGTLWALPAARRLVRRRLAPTLSQVMPRLLDVLSRPERLAIGLGGAFTLTLGYILALYASVQAFGGSVPLAAVAVVFLAGSAVGSAVPTPGGIGAIETALTAGLTAAGAPVDVALSATLLFRIATFWLRAPVGWACFTFMQRRRWI